MSRETNVEIFKDTERIIRENKSLIKSVENTIKKQKLYPADSAITLEKQGIQNTKIIVSGKRTLEAASSYKGKKVCIMNFASATNPGGGVERGSNAQEEALCRISTLYFCLNTTEMRKCFYMPHRKARNPLYNDDIIYSPDVCVIKNDSAKAEMLAEEDWYNVNVITCAAPNLRRVPSNEMNPDAGDKAAEISVNDLRKLHEQRIRRIFEVAAKNENEVLIAGAFGCGAFMNPPEVVAEAFRSVVKDLGNRFETVEFAVACEKKPSHNFLVFQKVFDKKLD